MTSFLVFFMDVFADRESVKNSPSFYSAQMAGFCLSLLILIKSRKFIAVCFLFGE